MITLAEKADLALRWVREANQIAYDVETSGLDWKRNSVVGYVISSEDGSVYIPVRHGGGGNLMDPKCGPLTAPDGERIPHRFEGELTRAFIDRPGYKSVVGHNLKFDLLMSMVHGVSILSTLEDTQVAESLLDEYSDGYSLDKCAKRYDVPAKKSDVMYEHIASTFGVPNSKSSMEHFWKLAGNDPISVEYAEGDGTTTLALIRAQLARMTAEDSERPEWVTGTLYGVFEMECHLLKTLVRMERRGMRVDEIRLNTMRQELLIRIEQARMKFPDGFNERSAPQVKKFMEGIGRTDWPKTEKGNPSFTEAWLKSFEEGRSVVDLRQLQNLINTFIDPLKDRHLFNGRVHPSLNPNKTDDFGTVSGRFSCSNPNLQQVPKRNKDLGRIFRSAFIPDDGYVFYEADYQQCEPRLFAHYSEDPALVAGYNATPPLDAHQVVADMMLVERDPTAKRMNMGIFTGMQPRSFASHMDWELGHATNMWNKWFEKFVAIKEFQNGAKATLLARGYITTLLGRRCRLESRQYAYRATSKVIQGGNADIIKYKLMMADNWLEQLGDEVHIMMTIHDSFVFQSPPEKHEWVVNTLVPELENVQCDPFNLIVPFKMDVGRGKNWAIATYGEEKANG